MTALIIVLCIILITIVLVQIGRVTELTAEIKGEREARKDASKWNGWLSLGFVSIFLPAVMISAWLYKDQMMGYGPHAAASEHGGTLDSMFNLTLILTGIVFVLTHIALFWYAYKYRWKENRKAEFIAHDNRLEVIWTAVPAVVMTLLVVRGLDAWNTVMADVGSDEDFMEIEATGQQFNWIIRYPGPDGKLGARDFKLTTGSNQLGQDFTDPKNWDDVIPSTELYLPVGKKVRVRITAKDVLHNFDLVHFRVKMDAVPGMPTYFVFTPIKTTAEYRNELRKYPEYNEPYDPTDPTGPKRWEKFEYELACAELCGKGHYSMKRIFRVVSQEEFDAWYREQKSFYLTEFRGKDDDPNKGKVLDVEVPMRAAEFSANVKAAIESADVADNTLVLNYVWFDTGSATLKSDSKYELDNLVTALNDNPQIRIEIGGHTDDTGDQEANVQLSQQRAQAVAAYLTDRGIASSRLRAVGYGDSKPLAPNDSDANRAKNRRTDFTITL
ncbi:MAG: OmpA family protein [Lewinellaceae bacterium]|nr:OmpA family protein [Lewinellaceae bacterium]